MCCKEPTTAGLSNGFTLVEMILVIVILGMLLAVAVPKFINLMDTTVDTNRCASSRGAINAALAMTYSSILLSDPTQNEWLNNAQMSWLDDSMFATDRVPLCPRHGTFTIVNGLTQCSIHN